MLKSADIHNLLPAIEPERVNEPRASYTQPQEINSLDDLLGDDALNLLGDDSEGLFDFKHTPQDNERADADFIARRKPCKDFEQYEAVFKEIQKELANGKRKLIEFREGNLRKGDFYVHNGVLMLLEKVGYRHKAGHM